MNQDLATRAFWQEPRYQRLAAMLLFAAAVICPFVIDGDGALSLPIAFIIVAALLWQHAKPVKLTLNEEISHSLEQWMSRVPDGRAMSPLRDAFQDHFQGMTLLQANSAEGARRLRVAEISFDKFLEENEALGQGKNGSKNGLIASARFHRAKSRFHLAMLTADDAAKLRKLQSVLHDLVGFEKEFQQWSMLVLPAIALRIDIRVRLNDLDEAESEQEILDTHAIGIQRDPAIIATRHVIADAMWAAASADDNEEIASGLRFRALIHYDDWLDQIGEDNLAARLIVAQRYGELEQGERVIALLADVIEDRRFAKSAGRRSLMEANRLLARAYLQVGRFDRALRFYSVLMSVGGEENPYLRDPQVLREIGIAEEKHAEESS